MRPSRRPPIFVQLSLLIIAVLLEITANFFANDESAPLTAGIRGAAGPALIILLVVLIVGNGLVLWWEAPRSPRPEWRADRSPYPGLSAFTEQDASVFFGREEQVAELLRRLHELGVEGADRFVCVTGASGSGKSSLVHAGVVPRLRGDRWQVLPPVTPAGEPLGGFADLAVTLGAYPAPHAVAHRLAAAAERLRDGTDTRDPAAVLGQTAVDALAVHRSAAA